MSDGAYLLNLVFVEVLFALLLGAVVIATYPDTPWTLIQWSGLVLIIVGAVVCYPVSKALWIAFDLIFRPMSPEELAWHKREGKGGQQMEMDEPDWRGVPDVREQQSRGEEECGQNGDGSLAG